MSHLSVLSVQFPNTAATTATRNSEDDAYFRSQASTSKNTLFVPTDKLARPLRSRSNSYLRTQSGVTSLPASPVASCFPQRPGFHRAATSTAVTTVSTTESRRFDDLHYSQTHFSRSTFLVYPGSETTAQDEGETNAEEDIRELLLASSDEEESSAPPSTPGIESARIPPRGSSVTIPHPKQSLDSEKSTLSLPEPITLLTPPSTSHCDNRRTG